MGFFKDFKDDFSQAVNELMPGEAEQFDGLQTDDMVVNTLESEVDVESELSKLDGLLEQVTKQEAEREQKAFSQPIAEPIAEPMFDEVVAEPEPVVPEPVQRPVRPEPVQRPVTPVPVAEPVREPELVVPEPVPVAEPEPMPAVEPVARTVAEPVRPAQTVQNTRKPIMEERKMADMTPNMKQDAAALEETTIITEGTIIKGDVISNGSLDIRGQVEGSVGCQGKLTVTGVVNGNSNASEFFADSAKIEGEVVSSGTVKIGLGSVIVGNVTASSAVIAGAIKGDIDVQGPVVVDTSAVVMGNIKSRSVQINNGAVIEGFCSQSYSDRDIESVFADKKGNE